MSKIVRDSELILLLIKTDWENHLIIKTDIFPCLRTTQSLVRNLLHAGNDLLTITVRRLSHHNLFELIKILNGVFLKWHSVNVDLRGNEWEWGELWLLNGWGWFGSGIAVVEVSAGHEDVLLGIVNFEFEVSGDVRGA